MLLLKSTLAALMFPLLTSSPERVSWQKAPVEIKGIVLNAETGKPIPGIYLFVTEGEEEALTDARGEFRIRTWKPFPLVLTSQNNGYHSVRLRLAQASGSVEVRLRKK